MSVLSPYIAVLGDSGQDMYWIKMTWRKSRIVHTIFFILPVQDNPSPVKPALHVQVKEPMVFWQTALGSQGEERHSSISVKYKRLWLQKRKITFTTIIKGLWGCPSYISTKMIRGSLVRDADIIRSQRGNPLRSPLRKVLIAPPFLECTRWCKSPGTSSARCFMPFCGRKNFIAMLTCCWNRCCRWHYKFKKYVVKITLASF